VYGTYKMTEINQGVFDGYFYGFTSPNTIAMTVTLFVGILHLNNKWVLEKYSKFVQGVQFLSSVSYGVYLVHMLFIGVLDSGLLGIRLNSNAYHPVIAIPATSMIVFLLSIAVVSIVRKIPLLKELVP